MELIAASQKRPASQSLERWRTRIERWPWATSILAAAALLAHCWPAATRAWQWQRELLAAEPWRLFTGHLTHWSAEHLLWDLLILLVAGAAVESLGRGRWVLSVAGSAVLISVGLWHWQDEMQIYRGLSGLDSALVATWAVALASRGGADGLVQRGPAGRGIAGRSSRPKVLGLFLLLGLLGKSVLELTTGESLFVATKSAGFAAVPLAHLLGGLWGGVSHFLFARR